MSEATTIPGIESIPDRLLTEVERQQKYLNRLPDDFSFPLFNTQTALESQRRSGYRSTAAAAREIVDNAFEAGADRLDVVFEKERAQRGVRTTAIAFIDNGSGMLPAMARYALSWGGGTHFDEPGKIGRFGFGLPNSSINQTRLVEVYTRTAGDQPIIKAWLDIRKPDKFGLHFIPEPKESDLPKFVQDYLGRNGIRFDHGTVVVWQSPDRLTYKLAAQLKEHLIDDFGVVYRYLLADPDQPRELIVEGVKVQPTDPLFLMPEARFYVPSILDAVDKGGAQEQLNLSISVRYFMDAETGERHLAKVTDPSQINRDDPDLMAIGVINIRVARFPLDFVIGERSKDEEVTDAHRRFEIRKTRRGMSFVRGGREIQTVDAFPRSARDESSGLGNWPLLQSYAYHWGIEVKFGPELDEVFGITNDKQGVRPIEDFWRLLSEEHIDTLLSKENSWQSVRRHERRKKRAEASSGDTPSAAEQAANEADAAGSTEPHAPDYAKTEARENLQHEAERRAGVTGQSVAEVLAALEQETVRRRYHIDFYESEDGPFYKPEWRGAQIVALINRKHPFYEVCYQELLGLPGGAQAKEALDVLLLALSRAELTVKDSQMALWYKTQRKDRWSRFLEPALESLRTRFERGDYMDEEAMETNVADEAEVLVA